MKKNGKKSASPKTFPAGTVVFPDGSVMEPEDWGKREPRKARPAVKPAPLPEPVEEPETEEELLELYGKYLDSEGVPLKGINPSPKYYVVPKETAVQQKSKTTVKIKVKSKQSKE